MSTVRRLLAQYRLWPCFSPSVRPSVCLSVTASILHSWLNIGSHKEPRESSFLLPKMLVKLNGITHNGGARYRLGRLIWEVFPPIFIGMSQKVVTLGG